MGLAFPKGTPRVVARYTRRKEEAKALREAYADVDLRDGGYCWITGRYTIPGSPDARNRREHHHLEPRSVAPHRVDDPTNIVTCCAEAHAMFKAGWLVSEGTGTRRAVLFHWTELASPKDRPFEIRERRMRGQE